jgi:hypothetical protein
MYERRPDYHGRAEELVAAITTDEHQDLELTALAAVAEAVLAVADEVAELRELLTVRLPLGPGAPSAPFPVPGAPSVPSGVIRDPAWGPGGRPPGVWVRNYGRRGRLHVPGVVQCPHGPWRGDSHLHPGLVGNPGPLLVVAYRRPRRSGEPGLPRTPGDRRRAGHMK